MPASPRHRDRLVATILACIALALPGCRKPQAAGKPAAPDTGKQSAAPAPPAASAPPAKRVREAAVAGSWYPGAPDVLRRQLDNLLDKTAPVRLAGAGPLRALISPHAGYRFSGEGAAAGYTLLRQRPVRRVVVLGVAHRAALSKLSIADVTHYRTPLGDIPLDQEAVAALRRSKLVTAHPTAHRQEHSIEMQLPLLQRALPSGFSLVPILVGHLSPDDYAAAADVVRPLLDDQTLLVASSDFTHYGPNYRYLPFPLDERTQARIRELDMGAWERIAARDPAGLLAYKRETRATICGFSPVMILTHLIPPSGTATRVRYYTSGEVLGDWQNSVSYLTVAFTAPRPLAEGGGAAGAEPSEGGDPAERPRADMELLHRLACRTLHLAVHRGAGAVDPERLATELTVPPRLREHSGAFVTLKKHHRLRGCIGTIAPVKRLHRAVVDNAVHAALHDRRFSPVTPDELTGMDVEVSVLSPPRPIPAYTDFQVGRHGIVLSKHGRRAVYLPEVASEQGWTREETLAHLSRKAGLPQDAWRGGASFEVFTTQIFEAPYRQ